MLLTNVKKTVEYRLSGAKKLPDDAHLSNLFTEAMYYVATKCTPNELLREEDSEEEVLRNIEDGAFLVVPDAPDFTSLTDHLMIDEDLTYSCIYYVCFLVSRDVAMKQMCDELVNEFNANYGRELSEY